MANLWTITVSFCTGRQLDRETTLDSQYDSGLIVVNCKKLIDAIKCSDEPLDVCVDYVDNEMLGEIGMRISECRYLVKEGMRFINIDFLDNMAGEKALYAFTELKRTIYLNVDGNSVNAEIDT